MTYLIAALFFLRLFFWRVFPQYGTTFVGDVTFGVICLNVVACHQLAKTKSPLAPFLFLWVLAAGISFLRSTNPFASTHALFTLSVYALVFCWIVRNTLSKDNITILWGYIVAGAVISAAIGIWEFYILRVTSAPDSASQITGLIYYLKRSCSLQGWPTAFAGFLILVIPTAFYIRNLVMGICLGVLVLGLASSLSILPALSLGVAFLLSRFRKNVWWILLGLGFIVYSAWETKSIESFLLVRGGYYTTAWHMITQHPVFGNGIGTFSHSGVAPSVFAHNSYLQVWAECGPLGFIGLSGVAITFFRMKPGKDMLQVAVYTGLLAVFIDNLFSFTMLKANLSFVWWVALALYSNLQQGRVKCK